MTFLTRTLKALELHTVPRPRFPLRARFVLILCAVACFSTTLALLLLDHSLSTDLRAVARAQLERAAAATNHLIEQHLTALSERYRAISGTPQFLANLEVGHAPTLVYFAERLGSRHAASLILFLDRKGDPLASSGNMAVEALALEHLRKGSAGDLEQGSFTALLAQQGAAYAMVRVPMAVGPDHVGDLVVIEPLTHETLSAWSELCGARVSIGELSAAEDEDEGEGQGEGLALTVRPVGKLQVRVTASLHAAREALAHSRRILLTAGLVALALALAASILVAQGLVRPIRAIQSGVERIGAGDLDFRLEENRNDEVGDVARAFNLTLERLDKTQQRLTSAQRLAKLGNWGIDLETGELHGSAEFLRIYGIEDDAAPLTLEFLLHRIHPKDRSAFREAVTKCTREGKILRLDHRSVSIDGAERILHTYAERVDTGHSIEGMVQDITHRQGIEDQIRYLAYHDSLTGLANRKLLRQRLGLALEQVHFMDSLVAVLFLDIDHFKYVNESLGHTAGDELLMEVADRVATCLRAVQTASTPSKQDHASLVARLGGDEFGILLTEVSDRQEIGECACRILDSLTGPFHVKGQDVMAGASIGIAVGPDDAEDVETLLRYSDTAMYYSKSLGAGSYQFYEDSMQETVSKRLKLESRLQCAIKNQEFELLYQPKVELPSCHTVGVEALIRWQNPEIGLVAPGEFIPLAEETGVVVAIGEWVLRTAVEQAIKWQEEGLPALRIAVNLSVRQMEEGVGFVPTLAALLEETGFDPKLLDLEITESSLMEHEETAIALLQELRDMGVGISLDDFGTGYSSLSYLRRLPIDTLKVDRSFVQMVDSNLDDAALAGAIIAMAKTIGLRVVVEGVETEEQREFLQALGCNEVQGYLFSTPIGAEEVAEMLRRQVASRTRKRKTKARAKPKASPRSGSGR